MAARMSYALYDLVDSLANTEDHLFHLLPNIAKPYIMIPLWKQAFKEGAQRLQLRLVKGLYFIPNCTGEEMTLHIAIDWAKGMIDCGVYPEEEEGFLKMAKSKYDEVLLALTIRTLIGYES
jgi:hypothetical protein